MLMQSANARAPSLDALNPIYIRRPSRGLPTEHVFLSTRQLQPVRAQIGLDQESWDSLAELHIKATVPKVAHARIFNSKPTSMCVQEDTELNNVLGLSIGLEFTL